MLDNAAEYQAQKAMSTNPNMLEYNKVLKPVGDIVVLEKLEGVKDRKVGGILVPNYKELGFGLTKAKVVNFGDDVKGVEVGDIVYYDTYSQYYPTYPITVTKAYNLVYKLDESNETNPDEYYGITPIGDSVLAQFDEESKVVEDGGIKLPPILRDYENLVVNKLGTTFECSQIEVGTKVIVIDKSRTIEVNKQGDSFYIVEQGVLSCTIDKD